jgi:surface antigen
LLVLAACAAAVAVFPTLVGASGSMPGAYPKDGDRLRCISEGYSCAGGGYRYATVRASGWPWLKYGGAQASYNSVGPHNCTLYAAYRLKQNGRKKFPGWSDNAGSWYRHVSRRRVNGRPAIGAIAEWGGHVAYVESVSAWGITISDDNYGYDHTTRQMIAWRSAHWPYHFLHLADKGPQWPVGDLRGSIVSSKIAGGPVMSWLVDSRGRRQLIPDRSTYRCLRRHGAKSYEQLPDSILHLLPGAANSLASCR